MTPDQLFQIASQSAMTGWVLIGTGLFLPARWATRVLFFGGRVIPLGLCLAYAVAVFSWWGSAPGGFGSLDAVAELFTHKGMLLAGWIHYLAFDLLMGRWQVDQSLTAPTHKSLRWLTLPCLFATLMFGPAGLLLFLVVAKVAAGRGQPQGVFP